MLVLTVGKPNKRIYVSDISGEPLAAIRCLSVGDESIRLGFMLADNCVAYGDHELEGVQPFRNGNMVAWDVPVYDTGVVIEHDGFPICRIVLSKIEEDGFYPKARIGLDADHDITILRCDVLRRTKPDLYNSYCKFFKSLE